jgi:hypothetical protein
MGLMAAPNAAAIMNAVPAAERGAASGIRATGMNTGMVLSMGGFFTLMAVGLAATLPSAMYDGLTAAGVTPAAATAASHASPVGLLFAAFLGDNPIQALVPHPGPHADPSIYGTSFFPNLISEPFEHGIAIAFTAAIIMLLIAAGASLLRGQRYVHAEADGTVHAGEHRDSPIEAMAREGGALAGAPGEEVAYEDALAAGDHRGGVSRAASGPARS